MFIIGVNNGLIPLNPKKEAEEEEERRLFYVGLTGQKSRWSCPIILRRAPGSYLDLEDIFLIFLRAW